MVPVNDPPPFQPEQEVRFAVVLFGGVSLAIYINGVVQELLALVRSTAPKWPLAADLSNRRVYFRTNPQDGEEALGGTERVYRRLGQLARLSDGGVAPTSLPAIEDPVRTRFVIDIISGTSAGGINGVFLAKAIANQQDIAALKKLWIDEGDIELLLNDRPSYGGLPTRLRPQKPPLSLLNGYRLYVKALEALRAMNATTVTPAQQDSPSYAEELELVVTTTDLQGLRLPIKLYDTVVYEHRYRNVFKFRFETEAATGADWNDFSPENDAMLAFAARCTSSFPFAFEPVTMDDLSNVLMESEYPVGDCWRSFFRDYDKVGAQYRRYAFADGGYLDNKPFSYATEALRRRRADVPVDRKLIYIEPDPKRPPADNEPIGEPPRERPDALANVAKAFTLPRSETIREDIAAVVQQNRVIRRMRDILRATEQSTTLLDSDGPVSPAYEELRSRVVGDAIADTVIGTLGIARGSDEAFAAETVVQEWARTRDTATLITTFDLPYQLRRLAFIQDRINAFLRDDQEPIEIMLGPAYAGFTLDAEARRSLVALKTALNQVFVALRKRGRGARRGENDPYLAEMRKAIATVVPDAETLVERVLAPNEAVAAGGDDEATLHARELLSVPGATMAFDVAAAWLAAYVHPTVAAADAAIELLLSRGLAAAIADDPSPAVLEMLRTTDPLEAQSPQPLLLGMVQTVPAEVRDALAAYADNFEAVDSVLLPLTYPDLGEVNPVEIIRISPQDARSLVDELGTKRQKLAGVSANHFGGFLKKSFRENDILWGRLDAAERIVKTTLAPDHPLADVLVEAAQLAIIGDDLLDGGPDWVTTALERRIGPAANTEQLLEVLGHGWDAERLNRARSVQAHLKSEYTVDRTIDDAKMLSVVGRGTTITGDVLQIAGDSRSLPTKPMFWVSRFGRLLWGLAELATPQKAASLPRLVFRNLALVSLLLGVALVLLGILGVEAAQKAGWIVIASVIVTLLVVWLTAGWLRIPPRPAERTWLRVARATLLAAAAAALALTAKADDLPRSSIAKWLAPTVVVVAAVIVSAWALARIATLRRPYQRERKVQAVASAAVRKYLAPSLLAAGIALTLGGLGRADRTAGAWFIALLLATAVVATQDLLPRGRRLIRVAIAVVALVLVAATLAEIVRHSSEDTGALVAKLPGGAEDGFEGTLRHAWCGFDRELWPWGATEEELHGRCR